MTGPVLLCTDGSDLATEALAAGIALVAPGTPFVVVSVVDEPDPTLLTGTGMAGGVVTPEEFDEAVTAAIDAAGAIVDAAAEALGLGGTPVQVLRGEPASAICQHATEVGAAAVVMGSRGRGGLKRALLGSVSDQVVRNAPCSVIIGR